MNYNFYLDIEIKSAQINIYVNSIFLQSFLYYSDEVLYLTFKFKEHIYKSDLDKCFYDFNIHTKLIDTLDYVIIFATSESRYISNKKLTSLKLYSDYILINLDTTYLYLMRNKKIIKTCINTDCLYFFNSLSDVNLSILNNICGKNGKDILEDIAIYLEDIKEMCYNKEVILQYIKSHGIDYFDLHKIMRNYEKLKEYILKLKFK